MVLSGDPLPPEVGPAPAERAPAGTPALGAPPPAADLRDPGDPGAGGDLARGRLPVALRLKALLPLWLPWARGRFRFTPALEAQLLRLSPRQMDRRPGQTGRYGGRSPARS